MWWFCACLLLERAGVFFVFWGVKCRESSGFLLVADNYFRLLVLVLFVFMG